MAQCTAKSKRTKVQCRRFAVADRTVCKHHGGKSPQGFEHPNLTNGKRSKFLSHLPDALKTDFTKNFNADDAQNLREQVAVSNVRTQQLLALLKDGDLGNMWLRMRALLSALRDSLESVAADASGIIAQLENIAQIGETNFLTWQQINNQNEQTRKLAESQMKLELGNLDRQIKENNYIPKEFVRAFVLEMADVVMKLSPESVRHEQLKQIQKRFMALPPVIRNDGEPKHLDKGK